MTFDARRGPAPHVVHRRPTPGDDAWIIFTSGSTGKPKGVAISHRSAAAFVDAEADCSSATRRSGPATGCWPDCRWPSTPPARRCGWPGVTARAWCPAPRRIVRAGAELGPWLVERGITVVSTVPTLAALWPSDALDRVRLLIFGGEACPPELVERLAAPGREVWNTYGPTEATVVACGAPLVPDQPVRIGLPLRGWQLAVVDPQGKPVRRGETGELVIGGAGPRPLPGRREGRREVPAGAGAGLGAGLPQRRPRQLRRAGLLFVGRADDQVKLGGRRIELGEIDAALLGLPRVTAAAAAVKKTKAGGEILVGYLAVEGGRPRPRRSRAALAERLPAALVPVLAVVDTHPDPTSGKVDRKALPVAPARAGGRGGAGRGPAADLPGTAGLAGSDVARDPRRAVEHDSDFFALGGNSLATATLVSTLRERHPTIAVADIYQRPTLGEFAAFLDQSLPGTPASSEPVVVPRTGCGPRWCSCGPRGDQAVSGLRWALGLALLHNLASALLHHPLAAPVPWWLIGVGYLVLLSAPGKVLMVMAGVRLLRLGVKPGSHPRGGRVHLQLWACERLAAVFGVRSLGGTRWAALLRTCGRLPRRAQRRPADHGSRHRMGHARRRLRDRARDRSRRLVDRGGHAARRRRPDRRRRTGRRTQHPHARGARGRRGRDRARHVRHRGHPGAGGLGRFACRSAWASRTVRGPRPIRRRSLWWTLVYTVVAVRVRLDPAARRPCPGWCCSAGRSAGHDPGGLACTRWPSLPSACWCRSRLRVPARPRRPACSPGPSRRASTRSTAARAGAPGWSRRMVDGARATLFPFYAGLITPFWLRRLGATMGSGSRRPRSRGCPG